MRTKFDKFDSSGCDVYWEVTSLQPYFDIICYKLGVPEGRFDFINDEEYKKRFKIRHDIYIKKFCNHKFSTGWEWDNNKLSVISCNTPLKDMGSLHMYDVTEKDIEDWEIYQDQKKYNL